MRQKSERKGAAAWCKRVNQDTEGREGCGGEKWVKKRLAGSADAVGTMHIHTRHATTTAVAIFKEESHECKNG